MLFLLPVPVAAAEAAGTLREMCLVLLLMLLMDVAEVAEVAELGPIRPMDPPIDPGLGLEQLALGLVGPEQGLVEAGNLGPEKDVVPAAESVAALEP